MPALAHISGQAKKPATVVGRRSSVVPSVRWLFALALVAATLPGYPARAHTVQAVEDCTEAGLDQALAETPSSETIYFACGGPATIVVTSTKTIAADRQIDGEGQITISGGGAVRVFAVEPAVTLALDNLVISDGNAAGSIGGGAVLNHGRLELDQVALRGNQASSGGAIYSTGALAIRGGTLSGNRASGNGGAIASSGTLAIDGASITDNQAQVLGGAIYAAGQLALRDATLGRNQAAFGGGLYVQSGSASLERSTVDGNRASENGGGVLNSGMLALVDSTLAGNTASIGGAISNTGVLTATGATLSGNAARGDGGGLANAGSASLRTSTLADNRADADADGSGDGGGAINFVGGTLALQNSLLATNRDEGGQAPDCAGSLTSQGHNLVQELVGCGLDGNTAGNINGVNPLLGPLAPNGGPTSTHALLPGSPAVDAGSPEIPGGGGAACEIVDQRGVARPVDGEQNGVPTCDIGAYELGLVVNTLADAPAINPGVTLCDSDPASPGNQCSLRAAIQQANASPGASAITFGVTGTFVLSRAGVDEDSGASGDLDLTQDLLLVGPGPDQVTIDGSGDVLVDGALQIDGVFQIGQNVRATIAGVTIRNGNAGANTDGGAIRNGGELLVRNSVVADSGAIIGGGIANRELARLTLVASTVSGNVSLNGGGGIYNLGQLTAQDSTIARNRAGGSAGGGGLANLGVATLSNVTVSGNTAVDGGGISYVVAQSLALNNVTVTGNRAESSGGGVFVAISNNGRASFSNTIIAGNADDGGQNPDCSGLLRSRGHNLVGNRTGCIVAPTAGDVFGAGPQTIDPRLAPLRDNGGATATHALRSGSPAINAGSASAADGRGGTCVAADQRGVARPQGDRCDIGANEAFLADIHVSQAPASNPTLVGVDTSYTLLVANNGPSATAGVVLTATLPLDATLIRIVPSSGTCQAATPVVCDFGTLASGASVSATLVLQPQAAGPVTNFASASAAETDPNLANNSNLQSVEVRHPIFMPFVIVNP